MPPEPASPPPPRQPLPPISKVRALDAADLGLRTAIPKGSVGRNIIVYGSPGVGKSYEVKRLTNKWKLLRTTFHPEYTYADFVGTYRPVVGKDTQSKITAFDGIEIARPITY